MLIFTIIVIIIFIISIIICELKMRKENTEIEHSKKRYDDLRKKIEKEERMFYEDFIHIPPGKDADMHIKWAREYYLDTNKKKKDN